jgi:hypothetical protein
LPVRIGILHYLGRRFAGWPHFKGRIFQDAARSAVIVFHRQSHAGHPAGRSGRPEAAALQEAHHSPVRRKHARLQAAYVLVARDPDQTFQHESADASALARIDDAEPQLGDRPALLQCHVTAVAYNALRLVTARDRCHKAYVAEEIGLREVAQFSGVKSVLESEESIVAGIGTQCVEVTREQLLVVGTNCTNPYPNTVVQNRIRKVL